ncbi:MAG: hypothetical protein Q8R04_00820 [Nanoarchaeota archaeon]|nr:hypothetical protein [Nanoarchaeota archaeon]
MAKIHGLVYIVVGLFVSIFSWKVNYEKFIFFFYVGLIFVFIGILKLVFGLIKRKMDRKEEPLERVHHKVSIQPHHQAHHYKRCHKCGNAVKLHDGFCSRCGTRF